jgi:hypothetical protein
MLRDRKSCGHHRHNFKAGRAISTPRFTAEELNQLRALAAQWGKNVSRRAFGDDGPGLDVDFRTFEQIATVAPRDSLKEPCNCCCNSKPTSSPTNSPVPPAASSVPPSLTAGP